MEGVWVAGELIFLAESRKRKVESGFLIVLFGLLLLAFRIEALRKSIKPTLLLQFS